MHNQIEAQPIIPTVRCRLRNRVGVEKPNCTREGPIVRNGSSMTAIGSILWVFGGLCQKYGDEDDNGDITFDRFPTNELWSFDTVNEIWSWHGCESVGEIPSPRWKHSAVSVEVSKKFIIIGGALDEYQTLWASTVPHVFHIESENWSLVSVHGVPPHRGPLSVAPFLTSNNESRFLLTTAGLVYEGIWDGLCVSWAETSSNPRPRADATYQSATVRDLILIFGGGNGIEAFGVSSKVSAAEIRGGGYVKTVDGKKRKENIFPSLIQSKPMSHAKYAKLDAYELLFPQSKSASSSSSSLSLPVSTRSITSDFDQLLVNPGSHFLYTNHHQATIDPLNNKPTERPMIREEKGIRTKEVIEDTKKPIKYAPKKQYDTDIVDHAMKTFAAQCGISTGNRTKRMKSSKKRKPTLKKSSLLLTNEVVDDSNRFSLSQHREDSTLTRHGSAKEYNDDLDTIGDDYMDSIEMVEQEEKYKINNEPPIDVKDAATLGIGNCFVIFGGNSASSASSTNDLPNEAVASSGVSIASMSTSKQTSSSSSNSVTSYGSRSVPTTITSPPLSNQQHALGYMYILDCVQNKWSRVEPTVSDQEHGQIFRAGHVMATVNNDIYIFGGTKGLASKHRSEREMNSINACNGLMYKISEKHCVSRARGRQSSNQNSPSSLNHDFGDESESRASTGAGMKTHETWRSSMASGTVEGGGTTTDEPDIHEMWANRGVNEWEKKGDITLRLPGECRTIVVNDFPKLINAVGRENCF